ncbi:MAG TPA: hypothetical protein VGO11_11935, partial [Chthoniobacteraceae bacterium]|nr:hypothetical protein [Chthoniobacteraceae bacterium]
LAVSELRGAKDGVHYLVTWSHDFRSSSGMDDWKDPKPVADPNVRRPGDGGFQLFGSDGKPLSKETPAYQSVVLDLDGDGVPEVIQQEAGPVFVDGKRAMSFSMDGPEAVGASRTDYELLKVCRLNREAPSSFALLYNANPANRLPGNLWGFQVRHSEADGSTALELGPLIVPEGIEPKVVFRWDKAKRAWVGPQRRPDDHWIELKAGDERADVERIAERGGLHYPLVDPEPAADFAQPAPARGEAVAKPYRAQSLAALSDEQLWAWMAGGRYDLWYRRERDAAATSVPDLWQKDPKVAALAYVRRNREPATRPFYLTAIPTMEKAAPDEGDFAHVSALAPDGGAYVVTRYHLHCAAEGSFLLRMERAQLWWTLPKTEQRSHWEVRRIDLSREQARRLFQVIWWMSRVRSLQCKSNGVSFSDIHAWSSFTFGLGGKASSLGRLDREGSGGAAYSPATYSQLTTQLLDQEVADWLGEPWTAQAMPARLADRNGRTIPQTAEEWARIKDGMAGVLRLFAEGKVDAPLAEQAVLAVGEENWRDLRGAVERVRDVLPPPRPFEKRLAEIEEQLRPWKEKFGKEAGEWASGAREERRHPATGVPALPDPPPGGAIPPRPQKLTPEEEQKFAEVDALYRERTKLKVGASRLDEELAALRKAIATTLRQLESFDDPEALFRLGLENPDAFVFALQRLVQLAPKRAVELLRLAEKNADHPVEEQRYAADRRLLEMRLERAAAGDGARLSDTRRALLLESFRDGSREYRERDYALHLLVPPEEPRRYADPEIDAALRESLERRGHYLEPEGVPLALAQRAGGKAWQALARDDAAEARTVIAQHEPAAYRAQVRDEIAGQLRRPRFNDWNVCWALWQLDLHELKDDLEKFATSDPEDVAWRDSGDSGHGAPPGQRSHFARQIASLWNELDPLTRARLLVAFTVAQAATFADEYNGALEHLDQQLAALRPELTPAQLATAAAYVTWCEAADAKRGIYDATPAAELAKVVARLRAGLGVER